MDEFEEKYKIREDSKTDSFHQSRRMFCVYQGKLHIAEPNLPYSHATWFAKEGWISKQSDELMEDILRGVVDDKGNIHFYVGYNFELNDYAESMFFAHLAELAEKLKLNSDARIFGGLTRSKSGEMWPAIKNYGSLSENLK
ncbi:hypothetical protein EPO05_00120 [Patescibacteria group bacterium]|nr:MAG: hypothetical protein EPO05_00120 [Patescibacteria group bacterium]